VSFRAKLLLAFAPLVLVPLAVLAFAVRTVLNDRFHTQFQDQLSALVTAIESDVRAQSDDLARRLTTIQEAAAGDNRFRLAASSAEGERQYLLDYAGYAMALSGLAVLQLQDAEGRVMSSGHFRNQFDQRLPLLGPVLGRVENHVAITPIGTATGSFHAIVRADSFRLGNRLFHLTAGVRLSDRIDSWSRSIDQVSVDIALPLVYPGPGSSDDPAQADVVVDQLRLPYIEDDAGAPTEAHVVVAHSLEPLRVLQRQVDRWALVVFGIAGSVTLTVAMLIAARISRPIVALAEQTSSLDLDRLDVQFTSDRKDEIGSLTRLLGSMVVRLRTSAGRLREAERRAAVGDMARQVNHDIKNGLVPIRNVIQHMTEVQREDPAKLSKVFAERRATIDSSIAYLERLATQYAKLTPDRRSAVCDLNEVILEVLQGFDVPRHCDLQVRCGDLPTVQSDRLALRRIVENLVGNAIDSLEERTGSVTVASEGPAERSGSAVQLTVRDTGCGMGQEELDRAFQDFYTTKPGGTGLGLSVVRRLIGDLGGTLRIQTAPDEGTTVFVGLPAAAEDRGV
jgi:signal transduction histidine kinase